MHVHRILKFLRESFDFKFGVSVLSHKVVNLILEVHDRVGLLLIALYFVNKPNNFLLFCLDVCQALPILSLALRKCGLVDLNLLIQQICLRSSANKLSAQDVSLSNHQLVFLLQLLLLSFRLLDDCV